MTEEGWYFAKHVFACAEGEHVILLDLRGDEYLCLPRAQLEAQGALSTGRLAKSLAGADQEATVEYSALLEDLLVQGLLTENASERNPAVVVGAEHVRASIAVARNRHGQKLDWLYLPRFLLAVRAASQCLRSMPLELVVAKVAKRRIEHLGRGDETDIARCSRLVAAFGRLRPFILRQAVCLFDSLALLDFLARCGQFPNWVFGVQTGPFSAHCWVQAGQTVLNDSVEQVAAYTPIMVV